MDMPRLAIAHNTGTRRALCSICNQPRDFNLGAELFRIDTLELVCQPCGWERAPDLVTLLILSPSLHRRVE